MRFTSWQRCYGRLLWGNTYSTGTLKVVGFPSSVVRISTVRRAVGVLPAFFLQPGKRYTKRACPENEGCVWGTKGRGKVGGRIRRRAERLGIGHRLLGIPCRWRGPISQPVAKNSYPRGVTDVLQLIAKEQPVETTHGPGVA